MSEVIYKIKLAAKIRLQDEGGQTVLRTGQLANTRIHGRFLHTVELAVTPPVVKGGETGVVELTTVSDEDIEIDEGTAIELCAGTRVLATGIVSKVYSTEELKVRD